MILRFFGLGILFFILLCSFPFFFIRPFAWSGGAGWLAVLLFVGFGIYLLAQNRRTGQIAFGTVLLFAGLAFLANNLWDFDLLRFWPLLLIFWGLILLLQRSARSSNERRPAQ